jgi:hypothetical protein
MPLLPMSTNAGKNLWITQEHPEVSKLPLSSSPWRETSALGSLYKSNPSPCFCVSQIFCFQKSHSSMKDEQCAIPRKSWPHIMKGRAFLHKLSPCSRHARPSLSGISLPTSVPYVNGPQSSVHSLYF